TQELTSTLATCEQAASDALTPRAPAMASAVRDTVRVFISLPKKSAERDNAETCRRTVYGRPSKVRTAVRQLTLPTGHRRRQSPPPQASMPVTAAVRQHLPARAFW